MKRSTKSLLTLSAETLKNISGGAVVKDPLDTLQTRIIMSCGCPDTKAKGCEPIDTHAMCWA